MAGKRIRLAILGQQDFGKAVLEAFIARGIRLRASSSVRGKVGTVTAVEGQSLFVMSQGGQIEVSKVRYDNGKKISAAQFCADHGVALHTELGEQP